MKRTLRKSLAASVLMGGLVLGTGAEATSIWASDSLSGPGGSVAPAIYELDSTTGAVLSTITGFSGAGTFADALSFAPDGQSIFVLDSSTNADVRQIDLAGNVLNSFSVALDAEGLTILADGSLIIGGGNSGVVATVDSTTGVVISQFSVSNNLFGLASDGAGTLFGLTIGGVIESYDLAGNLLGSLSTGVTGTTLGLAYTGSSFFISATGSTISEVALNGSLIRSFAGPAAFTEGLDFPEGIQVPPSGVPAPGTLVLLGLGLAGFGYQKRRKQN